jgi:hypothetical protein
MNEQELLAVGDLRAVFARDHGDRQAALPARDLDRDRSMPNRGIGSHAVRVRAIRVQRIGESVATG